jgi:cbb3-type cytochrome oxidase cytochrome c subunit
VAHAADDAREQGEQIAAGLARDVEVAPDSELVALVAYLQRLGRTRSTFEPSREPSQPGGVEVSQAGQAGHGGAR